MKLLAHVLRSGFPAVDSAQSALPDSRRWMFRDLVVRRDAYAAWGLWGPASVGAAKAPREPVIEPLWSDTQPWCHE